MIERRGFLAALAGLLAAPKVIVAKPPDLEDAFAEVMGVALKGIRFGDTPLPNIFDMPKQYCYWYGDSGKIPFRRDVWNGREYVKDETWIPPARKKGVGSVPCGHCNEGVMVKGRLCTLDADGEWVPVRKEKA